VLALFFYYDCNREGDVDVYSPPHHALLLDPATGKVMRFWACRPEELGISAQAVRRKAGDRETMVPPASWYRSEDRLFEVTPPVWQAFATGRTEFDPATAAAIEDYREHFHRICPPPLRAAYEAAAGDFFGWLRRAAPQR
jgi:hypothetical protein